MDYQAYSVSNFRKIPQLQGLSEEIKRDIEIAAHVLPFKVNNFVLDHLINWDDVPNDPIIEARSETYEMPFDQYTIPEAVLRFRQGFGRLIRRRSDRGVVAVFDSRIINKRYGRSFLDSLPTCTVRPGSLADLPRAAVRWLGD